MTSAVDQAKDPEIIGVMNLVKPLDDSFAALCTPFLLGLLQRIAQFAKFFRSKYYIHLSVANESLLT